MKILHSYCLNYNLGDYALGIGLKNLLRENLEVDLIGNTNIQGRIFDEYYINEVVNKKYDLLVLGGGGIIHGSHWPNGWFWLIDIDLIRSIKIPFIVYGVGDNYFENEIIPDKAVKHLRETFENSLHFSVRNDGSFDRVLDQVGISPQVVPDPGFHVSLNTSYERPLDSKYVIVQLANDKDEKRFGDVQSKRKFVDEMKQVVQTLALEFKVVMAPHVYDDVRLSEEIIQGIDNCSVWNFGYFAFDHTQEALSYYKYADFVIAMRGHGQIVPIGFDTPVIAVINHPKHQGLMDELGLGEYCVAVDEPNFKSNILDLVERLKTDNAEIRSMYSDINVKLRNDSQLVFKDIKRKLQPLT